MELRQTLTLPSHMEDLRTPCTLLREPCGPRATWQVTRHRVVERHAQPACPSGLERFTFQQVGEAASHLWKRTHPNCSALVSVVVGAQAGTVSQWLKGPCRCASLGFWGLSLREPLLGEMCLSSKSRDSRVHPTWKDTGTRLFTSQDFSHCGAKMKPS